MAGVAVALADMPAYARRQRAQRMGTDSRKSARVGARSAQSPPVLLEDRLRLLERVRVVSISGSWIHGNVCSRQ